MKFQRKMIFFIIGVLGCQTFGQKNILPDCMECIHLHDSLLIAECFDTLKSNYDQLEKMDLHYNFCSDSALVFLSSKNELNSIERNILEYLKTHCQSFSNTYEVKNIVFKHSDSCYLYKDEPFPFGKFIFFGVIALPIGIVGTVLSIDNLNQLKSKSYGWDLINAKSIDKTIGIVFVALSCIVDVGGFGLTTFGTIKCIQENNKNDFLKHIQIGTNKIRIIVDF